MTGESRGGRAEASRVFAGESRGGRSPLLQKKRDVSVEACKRHGVGAGIHNGTAAYALRMIEAGYQFVTLASESRFKAAEEVAAVRKTGVKAGKLPAY
jgi:4-hydroxy-2-oxoheptanedioate aldolase